MMCAICNTEVSENHSHCEHCNKVVDKTTAHTVEGNDKLYCCIECCGEQEQKEDKAEKKSTECEFC